MGYSSLSCAYRILYFARDEPQAENGPPGGSNAQQPNPRGPSHLIRPEKEPLAWTARLMCKAAPRVLEVDGKVVLEVTGQSICVRNIFDL